MTLVSEFVSKVQAVHKTGAVTEHSYRSALETLFNELDDDITVLSEPRRMKYGAPDFFIQRGETVIGHAEATDIGLNLRAMKDANKDQQERYRKAFPNLIYTNCLDWDFYRNGERFESVTIADYRKDIRSRPEEYDRLEHLLREFIAQKPQTITSPRVLAGIMAGKAIVIKDVLFKMLREDKELCGDPGKQYKAFREHLIYDIKLEDFADIYAETIACGMFVVHLRDIAPQTSGRRDALDFLSKSNPFLKSLFNYVAGIDLDDRIAWIIDDLASVFHACDGVKLMDGFGKLNGRNDPLLHFHEDFLAVYNPSRRKMRGVWYTPEPVVNFIVRAVDEVLNTEFGLRDGLADTSKVMIDQDTGQTDENGKAVTTRKEIHRVQVLDPAAGTGTFLAGVIKQIAPRIRNPDPGMWSNCIESDLIPRLHGFELLMPSYVICHMKLNMILTGMGYKPTKNSSARLSVHLTNSLEDDKPECQSIPFTRWLSHEDKGANSIRRDTPIMCVIGNPPYLGEGGMSKGWFGTLMDDYKKEPGGKVKLRERNPKWLNDLYVQFIRLSSHLIEKNGEGVLGIVTSHGYLDNPTFRGMRWHLLNIFDRIWVLDLHGNSRKKEVTPEGKPDQNVFDIRQGVSIIIGVKKKDGRKDLAKVMHGDLWGERQAKYDVLESASLSDNIFTPLESPAPQHPFVKRNLDVLHHYETGFKMAEFMPVHGTGIVTKRDNLTIHRTPEGVRRAVADMIELPQQDVREKYRLPADVRDWRYDWARADVIENIDTFSIPPISYRPLDTRYIYYSGRSRGFVGWPVSRVMRHMLAGANFGIGTARSNKNPGVDHFYCVNTIMEAKCAESSTQSALFPLYIYPDEQDIDQTRRVNFDRKLYDRLGKMAAHSGKRIPDEIDVFDYIYGVLHCPAYRETYAEFLKIDFPRIPWPKSPEEFRDVSARGAELRKLHLMDPAAIEQTPFPFIGDGDNVVNKPCHEDGKVRINATQYFDSVPDVSWSFYIGGYQPARKWLRDRRGRELGIEDIRHYQRILKILAETDRIMATITMESVPTNVH